MRSHEERRCSILGPTQSRISPGMLSYTKIRVYGWVYGSFRENNLLSDEQVHVPRPAQPVAALGLGSTIPWD